MVVSSDSDWAGDKVYCCSVAGYLMFILGVPIMWKSKSQKSVTLSSSEAEYCTLSEAAKDVKCMVMVLQSLRIKVKTPIIIKVDNIGAILWQRMLAQQVKQSTLIRVIILCESLW
jgi:hypothetical protein